jgi:hypothetical protein
MERQDAPDLEPAQVLAPRVDHHLDHVIGPSTQTPVEHRAKRAGWQCRSALNGQAISPRRPTGRR